MTDNQEPKRPSVLRLVLQEGEAVQIKGDTTIIANRKSDLVFKGNADIGQRYFPDEEN